MAYAISYVPSVVKTIKKLDRPIALRLIRAIEELADDPFPVGSIQLKGGNGERRLRVGDYRVIYDVDQGQVVVLVLKVGHRREVYRSLPVR